MDYGHEVTAWVAKHNTNAEVRWGITFANACIASLTQDNGIDDPYELAVWQARLSILKTKALLKGIPIKE